MSKIRRAESLVRNNGVCMILINPADCNRCPGKIQKFCSKAEQNPFLYPKRKELAQKYLDKKVIKITQPPTNERIPEYKPVITPYCNIPFGEFFKKQNSPTLYFKITNPESNYESMAVNISNGHLRLFDNTLQVIKLRKEDIFK